LLRETWSSPTKQAEKVKGGVERGGRTRHPGSNLGGNLHGVGGLTLLNTANMRVVVSINCVKFRVPITDDTLTGERVRMKRVFFVFPASSFQLTIIKHRMDLMRTDIAPSAKMSAAFLRTGTLSHIVKSCLRYFDQIGKCDHIFESFSPNWMDLLRFPFENGL